MQTPKTTLKTQNRPPLAATPIVSFADILAARRAARETWLAAHNCKITSRQPVVLFCPAHTENTLKNELQQALTTLPLHLLETLTPKAADFTAADIAIFPSLQLGTTNALVKNALAAGCVPVLAEKVAPKLAAFDYQPNDETGNSFLAAHASVWGLFAAATRAVETFRFPYDWKALVRNAVRR